MRKNFGAKEFTYPQPVYMVATYDENGVANVMTAAWGCISDYKIVSGKKVPVRLKLQYGLTCSQRIEV